MGAIPKKRVVPKENNGPRVGSLDFNFLDSPHASF